MVQELVDEDRDGVVAMGWVGQELNPLAGSVDQVNYNLVDNQN
ncbi:hypothetical protein [Brevibacillus sp. BC25]|nr:hypothetical protein [Brevibacillus sp. BC25]EJL29740.1 hypothetical protein PMI05_01355 [Brevibacillus sp. BC25]